MSFFTFYFKTSLTRTTLLKMGLRIAAVIITVTLVSYWHIVSLLELETKKQLEKYIDERGYHESSIFTLAEDNLALLKKDLLDRLAKPDHRYASERFDQLFVKWSDGTMRNRPQDQSPEQFDTLQQASVFIGTQVDINEDIRQRVVAFHELTSRYGAAWRNRFVNTYIAAPENIVVLYWPEQPWGLNAQADYSLINEEYFYTSDQQHNPHRTTAWTGVYLDPVALIWMVSVVTPVDDERGRHIATVAHDIVLSELMERAVNDRLEGTYNLIFREDGRLIVDPARMSEIQNRSGQLDILEAGDQQLLNIFEAVKNMQAGELVIEDQKNNHYLAVTKLQGPQWYFVTVYPKQLLAQLAFETAGFILLLGAFSLCIEIIILFLVLRNQIAKPLHQFVNATHQLATARFDAHAIQNLPVVRHDEIGELAKSFSQMAEQLKLSFDNLEQTVAERTHQLSQSHQEVEKLLLNILPIPIAQRLKAGETTITDAFGEVTVLFADIVGFTNLSTQLSPNLLVAKLNLIFSEFDALADKYGLEKIKTIGDCYMVVAGIPLPSVHHAELIADMALDIHEIVQRYNVTHHDHLQMRIGIHSGPVVAGVIGKRKFAYDLWGDTVNTASRMESHGIPGETQVTETTYQLLKEKYSLEPRSLLLVKGKGEMQVYLLRGKKL